MPTEDLPPLAEFLRWLTEMPAAFATAPLGFGGRTPVRAVVADLLEALGLPRDEKVLKTCEASGDARTERQRLQWIMATCHLLWHRSFRTRLKGTDGLRRLFSETFAALASVTSVDRLRDDEERREELVRRTLGALGLRLPGESKSEAEDRLSQVDSVERDRLMREAAKKEKRAREIREEMARRAAAEAAARYSPD